MAATRNEYLQREFNDHPSLASIDDYEPGMRLSPAFEIPSIPSQHSGFRAHTAGPSEASDTDSTGPWSPPAWRKPPSGWFQPVDRLAAMQQHSRDSSPQFDDEDLTLPANVPLPGSPEKRTPSPTPRGLAIKQEEEKDVAQSFGCQSEHNAQNATVNTGSPSSNNYIRFAMRAEVQQRTEPIEAMVSFIRFHYLRITKSKTSVISFFTLMVVAIAIFKGLLQPQDIGPGPDLVKVARLAHGFEPIIHYSESGVSQIGELQETGIAVWDLGESVRSSNMTSAPIIVRELDDLSESLKTLAVELTRFFANVDGDVDSILIVMDWAKRELVQFSGHLPGRMQSIYSNLHTYLKRVGGDPLAATVSSVFGVPQTEMTKATLQRTFNEFLNVLEESINNELTYSTALFGLFEAVDRQFQNLQRTVIRETDSQETKEATANMELAELWRRRLGSNKLRIAKFEKNQKLLASIKDKTVQNKLTLRDHNNKLMALKTNLESLRRRLVSPLVRNNESSTLTVEDQIKGLDSTYEYLRLAREQQKKGMLERLYGSGRRQVGLTIGEER